MEHNFWFYDHSHNSLSCGHFWFLATNWRKSCFWEGIDWSQGKTKVGIDYKPSVLREHDRGINPLALASVDCAYTYRVLRYGTKCAYSFWRNCCVYFIWYNFITQSLIQSVSQLGKTFAFTVLACFAAVQTGANADFCLGHMASFSRGLKMTSRAMHDSP